MSESWRDALMKLHVAGWNTDDIDSACEALAQACDEGSLEGFEICDLSADQVRGVLASPVATDEADALRRVADLRHRVGPETEALRAALFDLDAFAYEYAGGD